MKFKNLQLLTITPVNPEYFEDVTDEDYVVVGKVRPWDETDKEYILYADGDIVLAELDDGKR